VGWLIVGDDEEGSQMQRRSKKKCEKQNETKECQMGNVENEAKICYVCSSRGLGLS
jgi:hypothetical protein